MSRAQTRILRSTGVERAAPTPALESILPVTYTLESIHQAILEAFPRLDSRLDLERYQLREEELAEYHTNGFLGPVRILNAEQAVALGRRVTELRARIRELEPDLYEVERASLERPDEVPLHFLGGWRVDDWLHDLVFHPAITVPLAQCLGVRRLRFWHDQVFHKPAGHQGVVPWHQDYSYWTRTAPARHITLNLMLDDATEDSGCVWFVPGSHELGLHPKVDLGGDMQQILEHMPADLLAKRPPMPMVLRPGEATIHHSHTVHGSFQNRSPHARTAVVLNYMDAETVCVDDAEPLLRGVPPIAKGARVEGAFFPIALDLEALG